MRRTSQVMYVLRVIPRRLASVSMNSATSSSRVRPDTDTLARRTYKRYGDQLVPNRRFDGLERTGARKLVAVSFSLDGIVPKRVFGIEEGLIYSITHRANPGDVRKDYTIGALVTVNQRRISNHGILLFCPARLQCNGAGHPY